MNAKDIAIRGFRIDRMWTDMYWGDFDDGNAKTIPAAWSNSAQWIAGHLTSNQDWLVQQMMLGGEPQVDEVYYQLYSPGSAPSESAEQPSFSDTLAAFKACCATTLETLEGMSPEAFAEPPGGDVPPPLKAFIETKLDCIMQYARHESHHRGQLCAIRRAVGGKVRV